MPAGCRKNDAIEVDNIDPEDKMGRRSWGIDHFVMNFIVPEPIARAEAKIDHDLTPRTGPYTWFFLSGRDVFRTAVATCLHLCNLRLHSLAISTLQYVVVPVVWEFSSSVLAPLLFGSFLASHESWAGNSSPGWGGFELGQGTYTLGGSIFVFQKHLVSRRTSTWSWLFMVQYWIDRKYYIEWGIHCGARNMPEFQLSSARYIGSIYSICGFQRRYSVHIIENRG